MNPEHAKLEAVAKELFRRIMAEEEPDDIYRWMTSVIQRTTKDEPLIDFLLWLQTFEFYEKVQAHRTEFAALPEAERRKLDWPWATWNQLIEPLAPGFLAVITAPDGMGKTSYAECIAEHWAKHGNKIAFVHYELSHIVMLDRRAARHTSLSSRQLRSGHLTPEQQTRLTDMNDHLRNWPGEITYFHTPGWSMSKTIASLSQLRNENQCDAVVLDYLEKVAPDVTQLKYFGTNHWQREADNVEKLKSFAEQAAIPVLMVAQMNKAGKGISFDNVDRTAMRGAGEKSEKANLVVVLSRQREGDGYSNTVNVLVDKNTMGPTGSFKQYMEPEYYRVADIAKEAR